MRFITESDLRDAYKNAPFSSYEIPENTRLTPGARQFLMDRGLLKYEEEPGASAFKVAKVAANTQTSAASPEPAQVASCPAAASGESASLNYREKVKLLIEIEKSLFFKTALDLQSEDPAVAERLIIIGGAMDALAAGADIFGLLGFSECTGIKTNTFTELLTDCFPINASHVGKKMGRSLISLHHLRSRLRRAEIATRDLCAQNPAEKPFCTAVLTGFHEIINTLSRMICAANENTVCLRKQ